MEAIGFAASLLTLAATAFQASKLISELIKNCNECPRELSNLATAVQQLERLVAFMRTIDEARLNNDGDLDARLSEHLTDLVKNCTQDLLDIHTKLDRLDPIRDKRFRVRLKKAV